MNSFTKYICLALACVGLHIGLGTQTEAAAQDLAAGEVAVDLDALEDEAPMAASGEEAFDLDALDDTVDVANLPETFLPSAAVIPEVERHPALALAALALVFPTAMILVPIKRRKKKPAVHVVAPAANDEPRKTARPLAS